jgi:Predicted glycosyltransferases
MKLLIGIPTINRADLLNAALEKYQECYPNVDILVIDNGVSQHINTQNPRLRVFAQTSNLGVAASWNLICKTAFQEGYTHALILNDDIELVVHEKELIETISRHGEDKLLVQSGTWCVICVAKKVFETIGNFDEQFFPAYFEDNDYERRIKLQNEVFVIREPDLDPTLYRNSMTIKGSRP